MWSVWSESIGLYLGQSLAMLSKAQAPVIVIEQPTTLPLAQRLEQLEEHLPKSGNVRIALSAALCPAYNFNTPRGVSRYPEILEIAHAVGAPVMNLKPDQLKCEISTSLAGVAAAVPNALHDVLLGWASQRKVKITSVQPLWSAAFRCGWVKARGVSGMLLQEPDSATLIATDSQGSWHASTATGITTVDGFDNLRRRWMVSLDLTDYSLTTIAFGSVKQPLLSGSPREWQQHWQKL